VICLYVLFPYDVLRQRLVEWTSQDGMQLVLTPHVSTWLAS
jgi:hypothetical protein